MARAAPSPHNAPPGTAWTAYAATARVPASASPARRRQERARRSRRPGPLVAGPRPALATATAQIPPVYFQAAPRRVRRQPARAHRRLCWPRAAMAVAAVRPKLPARVRRARSARTPVSAPVRRTRAVRPVKCARLDSAAPRGSACATPPPVRRRPAVAAAAPAFRLPTRRRRCAAAEPTARASSAFRRHASMAGAPAAAHPAHLATTAMSAPARTRALAPVRAWGR